MTDQMKTGNEFRDPAALNEKPVTRDEIEEIYRHVDKMKAEMIALLNDYISFNNAQMANCARDVEHLIKGYKMIENAVISGFVGVNQRLNTFEMQVKSVMVPAINFQGPVQ